MEREKIAGAAVAVSKNGETIFEKGFGYRDLALKEPVTTDTLFGCASVSKSFSAMGTMQLVDQGKVSVDDPVIKFLPEFRFRGARDMSLVRVRHLLSHTTGLPPMKRRPGVKTWEEHMDYLATADYELLGRPGEYFSYCNDTFLLLGAIIERVSGKPYRQYMTENVLKAIGMERTSYDINEVARLGNRTELYLRNAKAGVAEASPWGELGLYEVGGGVRSNVRALLKYGQVYLNGGVVDGNRVISAENVRRMWQPVYDMGQRTYYCFALENTPDFHGVTLVEHGGRQVGVSSNFGFVPEKNIAAAVLTNTSEVPSADLWLAAVNTALCLPLNTPRHELQSYDMPLSILPKFVGHFTAAEGQDIRVELAGGALVMRTQGQAAPLTAVDGVSFAYTMNGKIETIRYYFSETGTPWAMYYSHRMLRKRED